MSPKCILTILCSGYTGCGSFEVISPKITFVIIIVVLTRYRRKKSNSLISSKTFVEQKLQKQ